MARGTVLKRCGYRDPETGRQYASRCPKLRQKDHGAWWYRYDAPGAPAGKRRQPWAGRDRYLIVDRSLTFGEYLDEWLASKAGLKKSTRASYVEHVELYFKPGLGHVKLVELRDRHFEELYTAMRQLGRPNPAHSEMLRRLTAARKRAHNQPMTPARLRRIHATVSSALNNAVKRKRIITNPAEHVELETGRASKALVWTPRRVEYWRRTGRRPSPVMVWTPEQVGTFLDSIADDDLYAMWHLIAYRGLRRAEAVGLPDYDVDLDNAVLDIRETLVRTAHQIGPEANADGPKTDAGARTLSLDTGTVTVLRAHRERQRLRREALGAGWVDSGRFFTGPAGAALDPAWVTQRFTYLVDRASRRRSRCTGTTAHGQCSRMIAGDTRCRQHGGNAQQGVRDGLPPIRLHDLRHGSATYALAAGIPIKVVSEDLGHRDTRITENLYTSVLPELKQASADAVAATIPRRGTR